MVVEVPGCNLDFQYLQEEEQIPVTVFHYYDNKSTVDFLLLKPEGLFCVVDDASKGRHPVEYITGEYLR